MGKPATSPLDSAPGLTNEKNSPASSDILRRRDFSLLVVDDAQNIRQEVLKTVERLKLFSSCREAENGIDAYKKVLSSPPDLILCDLIMPSVDGFKFLSMIRMRPELADIPVIILTGKTDVETKIKGLDLGASDYVTKPFDQGELLARIKVQLKIKALQDELKTSNEKLKQLSTIDPLTQIYNRRHFMATMAVEFERSERYDTPLSFVMLDIDHFKNLNDTYGHQAGDEVLRGIGALLKQKLRTGDMPGRYGGEEFSALLPQTEIDGAAEFAERFRASVEAALFSSQGTEIRITASLGVASCPDKNVACEADLIRLADEALYMAKESGRNKVVARRK